MNILIVNDYGLKGGGAENRILLLLNQMLEDKKLEEVHVFEKFHSEEKPEGKFFFYSAFGNKESEKLFERILIEKKIDIVQIHNSLCLTTNFVGIAKKNKVPVVFFSHDYWPVCAWRSFVNPEIDKFESCEKSNKYLPRCANILTSVKLKLIQNNLNKADLGITASDYSIEKFESFGLLKGKWKKVIAWINLKEFFPPEKKQEKKNILFVGSSKPYKGVFVLVNAMKEILKAFPDELLIFAGYETKGETYSDFRNLIKDSGVGGHILLEGFQSKSELRELYQSSKLLVFPSVWPELFGAVWAEAMACGCPVVVSDVAGMREVVDEKTLLFRKGDEKDLAEKVKRILSDEKYADEISGSGINHARKKFDVRRASEEMLSIYEELIDKRNAACRFYCPICSKGFDKFLPFGVKLRPNAQCPECESVERHRLLWLYLKERTDFFSANLKVLDVAPLQSFQKRFIGMKNLDYLSADLSDLTMAKVDITDIKFPDNKFDCILCYHVLEHIPDDRKAMRELFRILKPNGWAILQSPIDLSREETFEDASVVLPEEREKVFGQSDHVRIYGKDYRNRLEEAGFTVKLDNFVNELGKEKTEKHGLDENEMIYLCKASK